MKIRFDYLGQQKVGYVQELNGKIWIHYNGETKCIEGVGKKSRSQSATKKSDQIISPMPGKVTKIFKKVGDSVLTGNAVIAIEAMKMEYILNSEINGEIAKIMVTESDQIKEGQVLVQIKEQK